MNGPATPASPGQSPQSPDPADDPKPQGYHRLADIMSKDRGFAIFRRFDKMNILTLLSLQAEIFQLERNFYWQSRQDNNSKILKRENLSRDFVALRNSELDEDFTTGEQFRLLTEIREKLHVYNELLLQVSDLSRMKKPRKSELSTLRDWLTDKKGGDCFQVNSEAFLWGDDDSPDDPPSTFVTLRNTQEENDLFTKWLTVFVTGAFHRLLGRKRGLGRVVDEESELVSYDESKINTATNVTSTILSSILPVITILVLNYVPNRTLRIFITLIFTATFAAVLAIFSSARRVEIFAATATFAAVEVVFIGTAG